MPYKCVKHTPKYSALKNIMGKTRRRL